MTAAHCFKTIYGQISASQIFVWVGGIKLNEIQRTGRKIDVRQILYHNYKPRTYENDIAILKVKLGARNNPLNDSNYNVSAKRKIAIYG